MLNFESLLIKTIPALNIDAIYSISYRIREAILYRSSHNKLPPKLALKFSKVFPEYTWICDNEISESEIEKKIKEIKKLYT